MSIETLLAGLARITRDGLDYLSVPAYIVHRRPHTRGYNALKWAQILNTLEDKRMIERFRTSRELPAKFGVGFDERVVEYPWMFAHLESSHRVVLDAGSVLNHAPLLRHAELRNRTLHILTLAFEGRPLSIPSPSYVYGDLRDLSYRDFFFDCVICLSTLEHVGMDNTLLYTADAEKKENRKSDFLVAVKELRRVMKPGGQMLLSVPFGKGCDLDWLQVFDEEMVDSILKTASWSSARQTLYRYSSGGWQVSQPAACRDAGYRDPLHLTQRAVDGLAAAESVCLIRLVR